MNREFGEWEENRFSGERFLLIEWDNDSDFNDVHENQTQLVELSILDESLTRLPWKLANSFISTDLNFMKSESKWKCVGTSKMRLSCIKTLDVKVIIKYTNGIKVRRHKTSAFSDGGNSSSSGTSSKCIYTRWTMYTHLQNLILSLKHTEALLSRSLFLLHTITYCVQCVYIE